MPTYGWLIAITSAAGAEILEGEIATFNVTGVSPVLIEERGGQILLVNGEFPAGDLEFFLGPAGDDTDPPCYSGISGQGYLCRSDDGSTCQIVAPPATPGTRYLCVKPVGESCSSPFAITVVDSAWPQKMHEARRLMPVPNDVGRRSLTLEDL